MGLHSELLSLLPEPFLLYVFLPSVIHLSTSITLYNTQSLTRSLPPPARRRTPDPIPRSKAKRSHGPKFYYIPHDRIVEEGETVTFQCAVKGTSRGGECEEAERWEEAEIWEESERCEEAERSEC